MSTVPETQHQLEQMEHQKRIDDAARGDILGETDSVTVDAIAEVVARWSESHCSCKGCTLTTLCSWCPCHSSQGDRERETTQHGEHPLARDCRPARSHQSCLQCYSSFSFWSKLSRSPYRLLPILRPFRNRQDPAHQGACTIPIRQ